MVCQLTGVQQWPQLQEFLLSFAKQSPGSVARSAMHVAITGEHVMSLHGHTWYCIPLHGIAGHVVDRTFALSCFVHVVQSFQACIQASKVKH